LISSKKKKKRRHRSRSSEHESSAKTSSKRRKVDESGYRRKETHEQESDVESGELSESELEQRRNQLLKELQRQQQSP